MTPSTLLSPLLTYCADLPGFSPNAVEVAETEQCIATLARMSECAAIMAVCGYFSRMRGPDAWRRADAEIAGWMYHENVPRWLLDVEPAFEPLYAGSAPVPAAQEVDVDAICNAYESGVGHRGRPTASVNPYRECTPEHEAYAIGAKGEAAQVEANVAEMLELITYIEDKAARLYDFAKANDYPPHEYRAMLSGGGSLILEIAEKLRAMLAAKAKGVKK